MRIFFVLILGLVLAGCVTAKKMNQLSLGMPKQQVIAIMGEPTTTAAENGQEILIYELYNNSQDAFNDLPTPYYAKIKSGKLSAYGPIPHSSSAPVVQNNITIK